VTAPLKDAEDDCFAICTTASFAFDAPRTKEGFVNFYLSREGKLRLTIFDQALPNFGEISIDCIARPLNRAICEASRSAENRRTRC
jgi:hypothetical protein